MNPPFRPPNPPDGSTAVTAPEGSGGDPSPVGATGERKSRSNSDDERSVFGRGSAEGGEPDSPSWCRSPSIDVFHRRTIFRFPRRSSSGYFSSDCDSLPTSPLSPKPAVADRAMRTPSPTGQVITHAPRRVGEARGHSPSPSNTRQQSEAGDMQAEAFGQQLRRIGDEYNRLLLQRRVPRPVVLLPNVLPLPQKPITLICVGLLFLLIGRWMYLQGSTNSQDHPQV